MRVSVLGATGFLGSWLVRALIARGDDVTAIFRATSDPWRLQGLDGLVRRPTPVEEWPDVIQAARPQAIVSLDWAGVAAADRENESVQMDNLARLDEILEAATRTGVVRFVGTGSQAEYGPRAEQSVESDPTRPRSAYARAKVEALERVRRWGSVQGRSWSWARVFSVYGPLEANGSLLSRVADAAKRGDSISLTAGTQPWTYLYAADAATALSTIVHADISAIVNVAHPEAPRLSESAEQFASFLGDPRVLRFGEVKSLTDELVILQADTTQLRSLGWHATVGTRDGLEITARWFAGEQPIDPFESERRLPARSS